MNEDGSTVSVIPRETDAEKLKSDIEELRKLILDEILLTCPTDDVFLLRFLRARNYNVSRAFTSIQQFYRAKANYPEIFLYNRPSELLKGLRDNFLTILPERDKNGRSVVLFKPGNWEPSNCAISDVIRIFLFGIDLITEEEETQRNGMVLIEDWKNVGWRHFKHIRPWTLRKWIRAFAGCIPLKVKAVHIVHTHLLFNILEALVVPFLSQKILRRIHLHGNDLESLHKYLEPNILPAELGGSQPLTDNSSAIEQLLVRDDEFYRLSKFGYTTN